MFERAIDPTSSTKEFVGTRSSPRRCRFCLRVAPDATFRSEAHVVPEAFGNRSLLSVDECDACNQDASLFENDLAALLFGSRLFSMHRSKKPSVKLRHGRSPAFVEATPSRRMLVVRPDASDNTLRIARTATGFALKVKVPPHRPSNVVKALARMAFFTVPDALRAELDHVRRWLRGEEVWQAAWFCMFQAPEPGILTRTTLQVYVPDAGAPPTYPPLHIRFAYGRTMVTTQVPGPGWRVSTTVFSPGAKVVFAPPDEVNRDFWHEMEFVSTGPSTLIASASEEVSPTAYPTHEDVALAAYHRHVVRAGGPGDALGDWLAAEQDLFWASVGVEPPQ